MQQMISLVFGDMVSMDHECGQESVRDMCRLLRNIPAGVVGDDHESETDDDTKHDSVFYSRRNSLLFRRLYMP